MKQIRTVYLFKFLEDKSRYFTSLAFFAVLLTITLFIEQTDNPKINQVITILQSSSLMLLIICILPLYKQLKKSKAMILKIFFILIFMLMAGLTGYLWYAYKGVVTGILFIAAMVVGVIHLMKIKDIVINLLKKNLGVLKKEWYAILIFILIAPTNIYLIFNGKWDSQFVEIYNIFGIIQNVVVYLFMGYIFAIFILILGLISDIGSKIKNKIIKKS